MFLSPSLSSHFMKVSSLPLHFSMVPLSSIPFSPSSFEVIAPNIFISTLCKITTIVSLCLKTKIEITYLKSILYLVHRATLTLFLPILSSFHSSQNWFLSIMANRWYTQTPRSSTTTRRYTRVLHPPTITSERWTGMEKRHSSHSTTTTWKKNEMKNYDWSPLI